MDFRFNLWRPFLLTVIGAMIITEIVILSPSPLEESKVNAATVSVEPEQFVLDHAKSLAPGLPKNRIPEYSVDQFHYVSVQNGEKQWRIEADKAFLYNPERLVHSRIVTAYLYDGEGKITKITGQESKYYLKQRELEVFGHVKTIFPDGFELDSEYLSYKPNDRHIVIPPQYEARGIGHENAGQSFEFTSMGLDYYMGDALIHLSKNVVFTLEKTTDTEGRSEKTKIKSDHCLINRNKNLAQFTMNPERPLASRFVNITQPTLFVKSRRADMSYGSFAQILQYLTAYDDVLILEEPAKNPASMAKFITDPMAPSVQTNHPFRYATGGRADFDTQKNVIVITQFPQVYQDSDTVTGDVILLHRDTDIVEVEHSNAFSQGGGGT